MTKGLQESAPLQFSALSSSRESQSTTRARSNSFNFVPVRDVPRAKGTPCPIVADTQSFDVARSLFLRLKDRMRLFETLSGDFSDEELLRIKERDQQIYADVSAKIAPDDFASDLRKLRLSGECDGCSKRPSCGGAWVATQDDVFSRDVAHVAAILRRLSGSVLDVGCGEGPYLSAIAERVQHGALHYVGLDPDPARIRLLHTRHPWASYFVGDLAAFITQSGAGSQEKARPSFDHALVLRSYNHLPDPARALELLISLLRPGGSLLVVDNVAYGLVRSTGQAQRAERSAAEFEHFHNHYAGDAERILQRFPVRLLERREVSPQTSNEWVLHYEKMGDEA